MHSTNLLKIRGSAVMSIINELRDYSSEKLESFFDNLPSPLGITNYFSPIDKKQVTEALNKLKLMDRTSGGQDLLYFAIQCGHMEAINFLLELEFNRNLNDRLINAAYYGYIAAFKLFLARGADLDSKSGDLNGAWRMAARGGCIEMVQYLIRLGFDVHEREKYGRTVLHEAASSGNCELIALLIEKYGLNPNVNDKKNYDQLLSEAKAAEQRRASRKNYKGNPVEFCTNKEGLNQYYANYLASFIAPATTIPAVGFPPGVDDLIAGYAAPNPKERPLLEQSIENLQKERLILLQPFIEFCKHDAAGYEAREFLKKLLANKTLLLNDLEREIDGLLEKHQGKPYCLPLLLIRFEMAKKTGNPPKAAPQDLLILKKMMENTDQQLLQLQAIHQELQTTHQSLNAKYQELQKN